MAPRYQQGIIIVIDIGKNTSMPDGKKEKPFFEDAVECATRIIEKKIISQGKDLIGIILMGTKITENNLANQCDNASFRHIQLYKELQEPTWEMIRNMPDKSSKSKADWLEALIVAADYFKNGISGVTLLSKKIIFMTNLKAPVHIDDNEKMIINGLIEENIEVDFIGVDIYDENQKGEDFDLARRIIDATEGTSASFECAMSYLLFYRKKAINPTPWNVDLSIGPDVKIPVSAYVRIKDEPVVKKWNKAIKDPETGLASTTEAVEKTKYFVNKDKQTLVGEDKIIKGYEYGQKTIPLSDNDKNLFYNSGEKCLSVYGFTHKSNITWQILNSDGLQYVFGRKNNKNAQFALQCLVECLFKENLVGIVRKVHNKGNAPKMFALMPVIDSDNFICLSLVGICFMEDIKFMTFPPIDYKKFQCSEKQIDGFKALIKAMDLTKAYDDTYDDSEAFPTGKTVSPTVQYVLDCIAHRAKNPDKPLPQPRDEILSLFNVPPLIEKQAKEPIDTLKTLFSLHKVEANRNKRKRQYNVINESDSSKANINSMSNHDMPKVLLPNPKQPKLLSQLIGTVNPVNDFETLQSEGKTLADLSLPMIEAIESLMNANLDGTYSKALEAMSFFRSKCSKSEPWHYNNWLQKYKAYMIQSKRNEILDLINEKNVNYILKEENVLSEIEKNDDDSQLYECNTIPDDDELTLASEFNEMFDNM